jgi:hypothetical protein
MEIQNQTVDRINVIPIELILQSAGIKIDRSNSLPCPTGHESKSGKPASIHKTKNYLHCFNCNQTWDTIGVYMLIHQVNFKTALSQLANQFNIPLPQSYQLSTKSNQPKSELQIKRDVLIKELRSKAEKEKKIRHEFQCREEIITNLACYYVQRLQQIDKDFAVLDQEKLEAINPIQDDIKITRNKLNKLVRQV